MTRPFDPEPIADSLADAGDPSDERQERLVGVLDGYVAALERGEAEPIEAVVARHPDLAEELAECLEGVRVIHEAVEAARPAATHDPADPVGADPTPTIDLPAAGAAEESADLPGGEPRVIGDYRLLREIGRGGMGVVYEAEERSLRRRVALKVLPFAAVLDQRQIARFRNEAQAAAGLHHPHIVPVFAIGQERGIHYYAMPMIDGQSLGQAIEELRRENGALDGHQAAVSGATTLDVPGHSGEAGPRPEGPASRSVPSAQRTATAASLGSTHRSEAFFRAVARLGADAADALQHAHEQGVVHRDVKPSNLLLDQQGKLWVADFGLARMQTDLGVTATGDVVGTLRYMSPEQARGRADQVDGRTDVYALGATLYELLTLHHAHGGDGRQQILERLQRVDPTRPRRLNPDLPADLENIVLRAMEKQREARYDSAGELAADLRRYLDGRPTVARPPTLAQHTGKWARRHRRLVGLAAAAVAVIAVVSTASALMIAREQSRTAAALAQSESHHARAERLLDGARAVLDRFGGDLTDRLAILPGGGRLRRETLEQTLAYYRQFLAEAAGDPRLAASAAMTRVRAATAAERLGKVDEARSLYAEAQRELTARLAESPDDVALRSWLARCLTNSGCLERAAGDRDAARPAIDRAVALRRELLSDEPADADRMAELAAALCERATLAPRGADASLGEAISLLERARRVQPDHTMHARRLAVAHNTVSETLRTADPVRATAASDRAVELLAALVAAEPQVDAYRTDLAVAYSNRAALAGDRGDWDSAADSYALSVEELDRLARRDPLAPRRRSELSVALASRGLALSRNGDHAAAADAFDRADRTLASLIADHPHDGKYLRSRAALWNNRGVALRDGARLAEAATAFARSIAIEEERLRNAKSGTPTLLAVHYANHVQVLNRLGRQEEAAATQTKRQELEATLASVSRRKVSRQPTSLLNPPTEGAR